MPQQVVIENQIAGNITQIGGQSITLGQNTRANSLPVAIASDQNLAVMANYPEGTVYAAKTNVTAAGNTGPLAVATFKQLEIFLFADTFVGGTSPGVTFTVSATDQWANSYTISTDTVASGASTGKTRLVGLGGSANNPFGTSVNINWTLTGAPTSCNIYITIIGK
jgi:hypothetical protein